MPSHMFIMDGILASSLTFYQTKLKLTSPLFPCSPHAVQPLAQSYYYCGDYTSPSLLWWDQVLWDISGVVNWFSFWNTHKQRSSTVRKPRFRVCREKAHTSFQSKFDWLSCSVSFKAWKWSMYSYKLLLNTFSMLGTHCFSLMFHKSVRFR